MDGKKATQCSLAKTQLFASAFYQNEITEGSWDVINRVEGGQGSKELKFEISGTQQYIDLSNCYLFLKLKITQADGTNLAADTQVAPLPYIGGTMFNQLRVLLNNELLITEDNYDYLSYFQTEFTANQSAKDSYLKASLYYKDTPNQHDTLGVDNTGFEKRRGKFALSRSVEIITKVHSGLFFSRKTTNK